jgi:hypothetical protein
MANYTTTPTLQEDSQSASLKEPSNTTGAAAQPPLVGTDEPEMSVLVIRQFADLEQYLKDWTNLAENTLESNIFYEPWFMLPALKSFSGGHRVEFVLIFANDSSLDSDATLCGLFPLERKDGYKGLPVSFLELWRHVHCFLCTPLVRLEFARECLSAFLRWLRGPDGAPLMEFNYIMDGGPFHQLLLEQIKVGSGSAFLVESFKRGLLRPQPNAEEYIHQSLSTKHRKMLKRQEAKLGEGEPVEYEMLQEHHDVAAWIEDFLRLESAGWKGRAGTALASDKTQRDFFVAIATEGFKNGRLVMLALKRGQKLVAMRSQFLGGKGSFTFKISFAEEYARFSPGVLLELENIRWFHNQAGLEWMDSCTGTDALMFNRLWLDHRSISTTLVSNGGWSGALLIYVLSLVRGLKRKFSRLKKDQVAAQ